MSEVRDCLIIGAGIVGAATAWRLQQLRPDWRITLIEKEYAPAQHQSGRNSGVVHAGVYYAPDSLKARLCRAGVKATADFCREQGLPYLRCGKLIVATGETELPRLRQLVERAVANGVKVSTLSRAELEDLEPHINGLAALHVPETAITDYAAICRRLLELFLERGGDVVYGETVEAIREQESRVHLVTTPNEYRGRWLIACAGVMADRLVQLQGLQPDFRILPFRGEYYRLAETRAGLIRHLIYPVPDPSLPFLGVHLTRTIDGGITVGPNAVLALAREAYHRGDWRLKDCLETASFSGAWRMLLHYRRAAWQEWRSSVSRNYYLNRVQRFCPELGEADLLPEPAGIRAQAVSAKGELLHDFLWLAGRRSLHVCNAPSPAATSAFPIADTICKRLLNDFAH